MSWDFFRIWGTVFNCSEFPTIALIAQQYGSPSIESLSVSISTITLAPAFANDVFMNLVDRQRKFCSKLISHRVANFFRAILDLNLDLEAILRKTKSYWKYRLICNIRLWFFCWHFLDLLSRYCELLCVYSQSKYQRSAGDVIKKKQILNIIKDAVKPNNLSSLEMFGGTLELTNQWARYLLKKLDRHKCKGTTEKIDNSHLGF